MPFPVSRERSKACLRKKVYSKRMQNLDLLERLLQAAAPSGFEARASLVWADAAREFASVQHDPHGNVYATVHRDRGLKIMLLGHLDEIGLIVTHIGEKGMVRVKTLGGWDVQVLPGQRMRVLCKDGDLLAVVGRKPTHLMNGDENSKAVKIEDIWLDFGMTQEEVKQKVRLGDVAVLEQPVLHLGDKLVSKALDNRVGGFIVLEAVRRLGNLDCPHEVCAVATVQEEIGAYGARFAVQRLEPRVAIAVDMTFESTQPGVDSQEVGDVPFGSGVNIALGAIVHPHLNDVLLETARKHDIKTTISINPKLTGTDADATALFGRGTPSAALSVPIRYMHSPNEMVQLSDIEDCINLIVQFVMDLPADIEFSRNR
jgi:putative aminopeptidase FrvX